VLSRTAPRGRLSAAVLLVWSARARPRFVTARLDSPVPRRFSPRDRLLRFSRSWHRRRELTKCENCECVAIRKMDVADGERVTGHSNFGMLRLEKAVASGEWLVANRRSLDRERNQFVQFGFLKQRLVIESANVVPERSECFRERRIGWYYEFF
jgi:hypothetical protein